MVRISSEWKVDKQRMYSVYICTTLGKYSNDERWEALSNLVILLSCFPELLYNEMSIHCLGDSMRYVLRRCDLARHNTSREGYYPGNPCLSNNTKMAAKVMEQYSIHTNFTEALHEAINLSNRFFSSKDTTDFSTKWLPCCSHSLYWNAVTARK